MSDQLLLKIDRNMAKNQQATFRYNYADGLNENIEPWGGLLARSRGAALENTDNMFAATYTAVPSSKVVNELRLQFARRDQTGQLARSELRRALHGGEPGRPDARDTRRRERGTTAVHAAAACERPVSDTRHDEPLSGASTSGRRASTSTMSITGFKRCRYTSADGIFSGRCLRFQVSYRRRSAASKRSPLVYPELISKATATRQPPTAIAICRCLCRTIGTPPPR